MRTTTALTIALAMLPGIAAIAQDSEFIYCGGTTVARIRTGGKYDNVYARATAINKAINNCISYEDTNEPKTHIKKVGNLWSIYAWDHFIISVYPDEAKANGCSEKKLAEMWKSGLHKGLKSATPVSKMDKPFGDYSYSKPRTPQTDKPEPGAKAAPDNDDPPERVAQGANPGIGAGVTPATGATATAPSRGPSTASADLLTVLTAFNQVRDMGEGDYAIQRQQLAANLVVQLRGGKGVPTVSAPVVGPSVTPGTIRRGPEPTPPSTTGAAGTPEPKPASVSGAARTTPPQPASTAGAGAKAGDPGTANAAIKARIDQKFELADKPFALMRQQDHPDRSRVAAELSTARQAFHAARFIETEAALDRALQIMGVQPE